MLSIVLPTMGRDVSEFVVISIYEEIVLIYEEIVLINREITLINRNSISIY